MLSNVDNFKSELELYKQKAYLDNLENFDPDTIQTDNLSLRQDGKMIQNNNIYTVCEIIKDSINPTISVNEINATTDPVDVTISYPKSAVLKNIK